MAEAAEKQDQQKRPQLREVKGGDLLVRYTKDLKVLGCSASYAALVMSQQPAAGLAS